MAHQRTELAPSRIVAREDHHPSIQRRICVEGYHVTTRRMVTVAELAEAQPVPCADMRRERRERRFLQRQFDHQTLAGAIALPHGGQDTREEMRCTEDIDHRGT